MYLLPLIFPAEGRTALTKWFFTNWTDRFVYFHNNLDFQYSISTSSNSPTPRSAHFVRSTINHIGPSPPYTHTWLHLYTYGSSFYYIQGIFPPHLSPLALPLNRGDLSCLPGLRHNFHVSVNPSSTFHMHSSIPPSFLFPPLRRQGRDARLPHAITGRDKGLSPDRLKGQEVWPLIKRIYCR